MLITCDKSRWYEDSDGFWVAFRTKDRAAAAQSSVSVNGPWEVSLKEKKKRRSLDANAYCWVLLDKLAYALNKPKTEIYRAYIREIGGNSETVCVVDKAAERLKTIWEARGIGWQTDTMPSKIEGCTVMILYYGSSEYDTAQMSRLINLIVEDCKEQGIETMTPAELSALMDRWEAR